MDLRGDERVAVGERRVGEGEDEAEGEAAADADLPLRVLLDMMSVGVRGHRFNTE